MEGARSPDLELGKGESVVGILPDDLKRLYLVLLNAEERTKAFHEGMKRELVELGDKVSEEKKKALIREHLVVHLEEGFISEAFWTCVRLEFPETSDHDIGVRKDWQVVAVDSKAKVKNALLELVEHLF